MKAFRLIQHWLIPFALISANAALIHLLYLLYFKGLHLHSLYIFLCLTGLMAGIVLKNKYVLLIGIAVYWIALITILSAGLR